MPCISPSRPSKVMPSGGVSGLPFLSNTAIEWPPYVVNQALSWASTAAPNVPPSIPPPVKPVVIGESGLPLGANLVALPCHSEFLPLPADCEVVADPEVALAVEHRLAARTIPPAVELERQHPGAGGPIEVWHEGNRSHVWRSRLAVHLHRGDRIELVEQREQPRWLIPGIAGGGLGRCQRIGRRVAFGRRGCLKQHVAGTGRRTRGATRERVCQCREIGHRRRLAAVERVLNCPAPSAGSEIDEIRHIASRDAKAKRGTFDRRAIEELCVGPDRSDRRHLVDGDLGRRRGAQHPKERRAPGCRRRPC